MRYWRCTWWWSQIVHVIGRIELQFLMWTPFYMLGFIFVNNTSCLYVSTMMSIMVKTRINLLQTNTDLKYIIMYSCVNISLRTPQRLFGHVLYYLIYHKKQSIIKKNIHRKCIYFHIVFIFKLWRFWYFYLIVKTRSVSINNFYPKGENMKRLTSRKLGFMKYCS